MFITVYNSEIFERGSLWYVSFAGFFACFIILSIIYQNYIGAIVLFLLLGGYLFFSISNAQPIKVHIQDTFLQIGNKTYPRSKVSGFMLEVIEDKAELKNLVIVVEGKNHIHSFKDSKTNIRDFVIELGERIPMLNEITESSMDRLTRRLKL